jgi:hypothetical protein
LAIHAAGLAMPQVLPCRRSCHAAGLAMPQVLAALVRSAPSRTIASANIRRDAALSFSRPAATRSSMAVKSLWVTAIAAIVLAPLHTKSPSIQTFSDSGIPHESSILAVGMISRFDPLSFALSCWLMLALPGEVFPAAPRLRRSQKYQ